MKIIVKKSYSTSRENATGFVIPIFKKEKEEYVIIKPDEFPNNGNIFITSGFIGFESDYFYEFDSEKLQRNYNYETDLLAFKDSKTTKNPSLKILSYYHNSNEIKKVAPNKFIAVYNNKFSLSSNKLLDVEGLTSDVFFLKDVDSNKITGPFKRNGTDLEAASFKAFEDEFEDDEDFIDFTDIYSKYDSTIIFEISLDTASSFLISDNESFEFLVDFKNFIDNKIGTPIDFTPISKLHKWAIDKLQKNAPKIAITLNEIKNLENTSNTLLDKLKWDKYISKLEEIQKKSRRF